MEVLPRGPILECQLTKRTQTSNRRGLDLGPGSGDAAATLDELRIFGHPRAETEVIRLSN